MRFKLHAALLSCAALPALLAAPRAQAQAGASSEPLAVPTVRGTAPVANDALVKLKGNTHPLAQARYDRGAASGSLATGRLALLLKRSPAQEVALREYLGGLQDPHAPNYRKWLTPASYGANFGIADADLQTVETWLTSQGFKIESVPASRNLIQFSGTTAQVAQAFHTSIHSYVINGVEHYSNASDPEIPAALAPVVAGISPLNDFRAKAQHVRGNQAQVVSKNGSLQVVSQLKPGAVPLATGSQNGSPFLYVTPGDAATIYDAPNRLNIHYTGNAPADGTGVNIGVAEYSDLPQADYGNYRKLFLGETTPLAPTLVVDGSDPGVLNGTGEGEETLLDAEVAAGRAPHANIFVYSSASTPLGDGLSDAALRAIEDNKVAVLSVSYGTCEADLGSGGNTEFYELWQEAAAQGITVVVATGDDGSAACDADVTPTENQATLGLSVSGIASTPFDVAVGGTDFDVLSLAANSFSQYVNSANTTGSGAGVDESALGYIPENPWNDTITNNPPGAYTGNTAAQYTDGAGSTPFTILDAGGGGASSAGLCNLTDPNGYCTAPGYPTPPFQTGINVGSAAPAGVRYLPDVSLFASPGSLHQAGWALCSDNTVSGASNAFTDCVPGADGSFSITGIGGTSASTPAFAGVLSMIIQSLGVNTRLGVANNVLYNLSAGGRAGAVFHDITAGNNSIPCAAGSPNCVAITGSSDSFLTGYNAATGYDLATGLGSVDIAALVNAWPTATFTSTTTTLTANNATSPITITHGAPVTLASTVTPSSATGVVSVTAQPLAGQPALAGPAALNDYISLNAGTGSINSTDLPGGNYTIQAYYPGDRLDAPSTSAPAIQVTVNPEASSPFLFLAISDINSGQQLSSGTPIPYGAFGYAYVEPGNTSAALGSNGYLTGSHGTASGTATLLNGGSAFSTQALNFSSSQALNSQGIAAFPLYNLTPGSYSVGANYSGDASYNPSSASATPLTIVKGTTTAKLTASGTSIAASGSVTVTLELDTDSTGAYPTGALSLTAGGTSFASSSVVSGLTSTGGDRLIATYTVPGAALASGSNTLTGSYAGDGNYNGSSAMTAVTVSGGSSTGAAFVLAGPSGGITVAAPGQSQTGTVTVTPTNGFTGTVNLSCSVQFTGTSAAPTCSIAPTLALAANAAATTTVTIHTTAQTASLIVPRDAGPAGLRLRQLLEGGGGVALCSLLLFGVPARRRSWRNLLPVLLLGATVLGVVGCGGSSNTNNNSGTATGTYTLLVTGTSGSTTANTQISLTVQ